MILALARVAAAEPVLIEADEVLWTEGGATATGSVRLALEMQTATAERGEWDRDTGQVLLYAGVWSREEGTIQFSEARIDVGAGAGVALDARFDGEDAVLVADQLQFSGEALVGEQVVFTTCQCAHPTWEIAARQVTVVLDERVSFRGGLVRVCGVPLLPVPRGVVSLAPRKTGFLAPEVGLTDDGWRVAEPFFWVLGPSADATVTPEWWGRRGLRGRGEVRVALAEDQAGIVQGALGRDQLTNTVRGAASANQGWANGLWRTGVSATWVSDQPYLTDYGDSFLARAAPWTEVLGVAGVGAFRLETDTFQPEGEQRPVAGVVSFPQLRVGPVATQVQARTDVIGVGESFRVEDPRARTAVTGSLSGGQQVGPVRVSVQGLAEGVKWDDLDPSGRLGAKGEAALLAWGDHGSWRHLVEAGVEAQGMEALGSPDDRWAPVVPGPTWSVGPYLQSRWLTASSAPLRVRTGLALQEAGWVPQAQIRAGVGAMGFTAWANPEIQDGRVSWGGAWGNAWLGAARTDALIQGRGSFTRDVPGVPWLRVGYAGLIDAGGGVLSHGPSVRVQPVCDCVSLQTWARFAQDRELPQIRFDLQVF